MILANGDNFQGKKTIFTANTTNREECGCLGPIRLLQVLLDLKDLLFIKKVLGEKCVSE